jgi:hypothetical protein
MSSKDGSDGYDFLFDDELPLEEKMIVVLEMQKNLFQGMTKVLSLLEDSKHRPEVIKSLESTLNSLKYGNVVIQKWLGKNLPAKNLKLN